MHYTISDIHGNMKAFKSILEKIKFNDEDHLYVLGDVVDRYPYGIDILVELMNMKNATLILGNHEQQFLDWGVSQGDGNISQKYQQAWVRNGGPETLASFNKLKSKDPKEADRLIQYIKNAPLTLRVSAGGKSFNLMHNTNPKKYKLADKYEFKKFYASEKQFSLWDRHFLFDSASSIGITVFGHTPVNTLYKTLRKNECYGIKVDKKLMDQAKEYRNMSELNIFTYNKHICIDCGSSFPSGYVYTEIDEKTKEEFSHPCKGRLACLRLEDLAEFYSR